LCQGVQASVTGGETNYFERGDDDVPGLQLALEVPQQLQQVGPAQLHFGVALRKRGAHESKNESLSLGRGRVGGRAPHKKSLTLRVLLPSSACIVPRSRPQQCTRASHFIVAASLRSLLTRLRLTHFRSGHSRHGGMHTTAVHRLSFVRRRSGPTHSLRRPAVSAPNIHAIFGAPPPSSACRADDRVQPAATQVA
jgi:hypothetical protein